jgi:MFS superfamily sulfate permease-like transporter
MTKYFKTINNDLPAGLVVFLVALPLCVGIAIASGAPPFSGIISGIVGGLIVSWLSGSQLSVSGPAAGLTVILFNGIHKIGSYEGLLTATIIAGVVQIILGYARAGIIGHYFPSSVIRGMLASIGLILIFKQIPTFLGIDTIFFGIEGFRLNDTYETFSKILHIIINMNFAPFIIGIISLILMLIWEKPAIKNTKILKLIPGAFVAVFVSIGLNEILIRFYPSVAITGKQLVSLPTLNHLSELNTHLISPDFSVLSNWNVWVVAFTISIIASIETLLSIEAADKLDPNKNITPTSRELKAQGVGNIISGLLGGIPMTAVIVRTSANISAGGRSKMSSFIHGLFLTVSILSIPNILNKIPLSTLAVVLIVIGFKLTKPALYNNQYQLGPEQFIPFITTIISVLLTDLLIGISIGMILGVFFVLKANYLNPYSYEKIESDDHHIIKIRLSEQLSFINKASINKLLHELPEKSIVEINGEFVKYIDYDVLEEIYEFKSTAKEKNISLTIKNIPYVSLKGSYGH